jgi:hypothetical protein
LSIDYASAAELRRIAAERETSRLGRLLLQLASIEDLKYGPEGLVDAKEVIGNLASEVDALAVEIRGREA